MNTDRHVSNFCDDRMLTCPEQYLDSDGSIMLEKLEEEYKKLIHYDPAACETEVYDEEEDELFFLT